MGLFGALFAGVSGLDSQSNKIGIISNNISNVNTVGFKQGQASFDTLVVPSGTTSFSPGGVIGSNQQLVNQQGLVSATTSSTDIAITGGGLLFVSATATVPGQTAAPVFTRAGSFTQDASGNFINSNGYYLLGLPINAATGKPVSVNTSALTTVNVSSSATGKPTPTSSVTFGANFDADQTPLLGPGINITALQGNANSQNTASDILIGNDVTGQDSNTGILRGDSFSITNSVSTTPDVFTYGGFSIGRNVTVPLSGTNATVGGQAKSTSPTPGGLGDGANLLDQESIAANNITTNTTNGTKNQITISGVANTGDYVVGQSASISGITAGVGGLTPAELNGEWQVIASGGGSVTLQIGTNATSVATGGSTFTASNRTAAFGGNILDAKSETDDFLSTTGASNFTNSAVNFSIAVGNVGTLKLSYSSNPEPSSGTFNSLDTLASAINDSTTSGLTARVEGGRIYISAANANNSVTYINGDATGNGSTALSGSQLSGINWVQELDLPAAGTAGINAGSTVSGQYYFNTLSGLKNAVNTADPQNLVATITNPTGLSSLSINEANSQETIQFDDGNTSTTPTTANTGGSLLKEFGVVTGTSKNQSTGKLLQTYQATDPQKNMSSGVITPQFTKDFTIYDSLGKPHTLAINVAKLDTATATWAVEITAVPPTDVKSADSQSYNGDGLIADGTVQFSGNGNIIHADAGLQSFTINWNPQTVGANTSTIKLDLGLSPNSTNTGLTQAAGAFNVTTDTQNGSPTGELTGVSIDQNGFVIASFSNGQTQKMFQLPLANFTNPDGLLSISGDAYQSTLASGAVNPELAGTSGVGTFTPSALEQSNVDLSTQLTDLIVAQQAYGANSKVLTVADTLLQELDQIIQ